MYVGKQRGFKCNLEKNMHKLCAFQLECRFHKWCFKQNRPFHSAYRALFSGLKLSNFKSF